MAAPLTDRPVRFGVVGTGGIASSFTTDLQLLDDAVVSAVGSRSQASADRFGDAHGIARRHASYADLVDDLTRLGLPAGTPAERERIAMMAEAMIAQTEALARGYVELERPEYEEPWAGLRPTTADGLPILGRGPVPGLFLATGHFRNGILLAPVTALALAEELAGAGSRDLTPFSIGRFHSPGVREAGAPPELI